MTKTITPDLPNPVPGVRPDPAKRPFPGLISGATLKEPHGRRYEARAMPGNPTTESEERTMRIRAVAVALMLALAACGGTDPAADGSGDGPTETETTTTTTSDDELTLGSFFGWTDDPEADQQRWEEEERLIQESIRQCMAEQGFEYIPMDFPDEEFIFEEPDEEERVRTMGFGITTWVDQEEQFFEGPDWEDPNQPIIEAMSESERDAYFKALHGDWENFEPQIDPETGEEIWEDMGFGEGCEGQAYEEAYGDDQRLWEELGPELEAMHERIQADPRMVELQTQWASCMADAGYQFSDQEALWRWIETDFQPRADEILQQMWGGDPFEGWTEAEINAFFEDNTEEEIEAFFREFEQTQRQEVDQEALAALQQEEIALAVADYECHKDQPDIWEEVSKEYEAQFIREHLEQLEEIRDAMDN
jgi:hypothetical protein